MATKRSNIIVGAAALYIAPAGTALPALTADGSARVALETDVAWTEVGFTQEGIEFSYEPDFGEVEVDQFMGPAKMFKQNQNVSVNTTLAEASLENLLVAWGQADDSLAGDVLEIRAGSLGEVPVERALAFVGPAPVRNTGTEEAPVWEARERVYHVRYGIQTESSSHALRKNEATVFPVSFRVLPGDDGLFGTIRDRALDQAPLGP